MTKVNPNNGNETKQTFFHVKYSDLISFFIGPKILKYFNDFHNWSSSNFIAKVSTTKIKIKWDMGKSDSIFPYLQSSTLFK